MAPTSSGLEAGQSYLHTWAQGQDGTPPGPWRPLADEPPMFFSHLGCLRASGCDSPPGLGFPSHKKKLSIQAPDRLNFDL